MSLGLRRAGGRGGEETRVATADPEAGTLFDAAPPWASRGRPIGRERSLDIESTTRLGRGTRAQPRGDPPTTRVDIGSAISLHRSRDPGPRLARRAPSTTTSETLAMPVEPLHPLRF